MGHFRSKFYIPYIGKIFLSVLFQSGKYQGHHGGRKSGKEDSETAYL